MSTPVDTQILTALDALIKAAGIAGVGVHIGRSDADPFEPSELPAVNLLPIDESITTETRMGSAVGAKVLQMHALSIVVQVITRGGSAAENQSRLISAQCEAAIGADPTLGGICRQTMYLTAKQWIRDDGSEQRLARQNSLYQCEYRTYSGDPFTSV